MSAPRDAPAVHDQAFELIPWLVNGRISPTERDWVERHVGECELCRQEVAEQQRLRQMLKRDDSNVEHAPHAALQKLWARIEQSPSGSHIDTGLDHELSDRRARPDGHRLQPLASRWRIAAAAVLAIGIGLLLATSWLRVPAPTGDANYRTASTPPAQPDRVGQVRAVFSPTVTVEELTRIVSDTRLTIVAGPSASGVYTLASMPGQELPMSDVLARLRSDPRVRFAEPVVAESRGPP